MNQEQLLENKELREQMVRRIEVLEKVKKLLLIPQTDFATVKQVAEYYEVSEETIKAVMSRHRDELLKDGMKLKSYKDFLNVQDATLEKSKGKTTFLYNDGLIMEVPNRGIKVFPRRAILRIGMLLRDSEIAKEVRTQLLNIEEKASDPEKVLDISNEENLMMEVGRAYASGDADGLLKAATSLMAFKNRHIEKLEISNKALANGILEWEDRSRLNYAVRKLSNYAHIDYPKIWTELYKQLKNKFHIDLPARGKQPWIQYIEEDEWNNVIKCFSALCKYYNQEPVDMFHDLEVK